MDIEVFREYIIKIGNAGLESIKVLEWLSRGFLPRYMYNYFTSALSRKIEKCSDKDSVIEEQDIIEVLNCLYRTEKEAELLKYIYYSAIKNGEEGALKYAESITLFIPFFYSDSVYMFINLSNSFLGDRSILGGKDLFSAPYRMNYEVDELLTFTSVSEISKFSNDIVSMGLIPEINNNFAAEEIATDELIRANKYIKYFIVMISTDINSIGLGERQGFLDYYLREFSSLMNELTTVTEYLYIRIHTGLI